MPTAVRVIVPPTLCLFRSCGYPDGMTLSQQIAARIRGAMAAALPKVSAGRIARELGISPQALGRRLAGEPEVQFRVGELLTVAELTGISPLALLENLSTDATAEAAALEVPVPALLYLARGTGPAAQLLAALRDGRTGGAVLEGAASLALWGDAPRG